MLTFYGHFSGWSSYPTVCRSIRDFLADDGFEIEEVDLRDIPHPTLCATKRPGVKLLFGFPEWHMVTPKHKINIGYHVCDVDLVPDHWVERMNELDLVLTPSVWCKSVFRACGVLVPIQIIHHGVHSDYTLGATADAFRFLHFCSAAEPSRKGTIELIRAFDQAGSKLEGAGLTIVLESGRSLVQHAVDASLSRWCITLDHAGPYDARMQVFRYRRHAVLVAPSRAEGFGMQPLEALASGIPVIATRATGHKEHVGRYPGTVEVPTGALTSCGAVGRAPLVDARDLAEALLYARAQWSILREGALRAAVLVKQDFAWSQVLQPLAELLKEASAGCQS